MKAILGLTLASLMFCAALFSLTVYSVEAAQPKTITVPTNAATISQAIAAASPGDTIMVKSGTYHENLLVDKSVSLVGDGSTSTVLIGDGGQAKGVRPVVNITAFGVKISGFTILGSNFTDSKFWATGISLNGDGATITDNVINGTYYGIFCSSQSQVTIARNNITNTGKDGIRWCGGSSNTFTQNNIIGNAQSGISLEGYSDVVSQNNFINNGRALGLGASYCLVYGNTIDNHVGSSLYVGGSHNLICANSVSNSDYGVYFTFFFANPTGNTLYHNNFVDNGYSVYFANYSNVQYWDNNAKSGNYFSDYHGAGNTPYVINDQNKDSYPLTTPINISTETSPQNPASPQPAPDSTVAMWHFDSVTQSGMTPDATGNNYAVLGTTLGDVSFTPVLVDSPNGKALMFDGTQYAYTSPSSTLDIKEEFTFDATIKPQQYKDVDYNIIMVESARTASTYPNRIVGICVNGNPDSAIPVGALRGFMLDQNGVFNEIVSTQAVVPLNQWTHVVFTRSLTSGMHLFVNGVEVPVTVTSGSQNPSGKVAQGGEIYIGHDSISTIDELAVKNYAPTEAQSWTQWWFIGALALAFLLISGLAYFGKSKNNQKTQP
jgi:hypothetical protein